MEQEKKTEMIKQHQGARLGPGGRDSRRGSKARDQCREGEKVDHTMLTKRKLEKSSEPVSGWVKEETCMIYMLVPVLIAVPWPRSKIQWVRKR